MDKVKKVSGYFLGFLGVVGLLSCLVDFAIAADIPPEEAKASLEQQAMAFSANFDVSEQGTVMYQFPVS